MYGLTRDFIRNGGAFMVLEKEDGLRMEELSRVQMGMLSSNHIPRLLPVHIREIDRNVTLQYDISGYKMLSQMLKSSKIKLRVLYGLLFQLADAFTECRQYMLEPRKLLIQEDYLFINGSFEQGELGMVYVPIMDTVEVDPTPQQFRELVIRLMAHVQELQGEGIQRVLQLCDNERWDIRQLRELLLELYADEQENGGGAAFLSSRTLETFDDSRGDLHSSISERDSRLATGTSRPYQPGAPVQNTAVGLQLNFRQPQKMSESEVEDIPVRSRSFSGRRSSEQSSLESSNSMDQGRSNRYDSLERVDMEVEEKPGSSKVTYIILVCMVAMALVWRFIYMEQPGQTQMILCIVLSLGLLGVAGWTWKRKGSPQNDIENKRSFSFNLGKNKGKQIEDEEEQFQESWRWNTVERPVERVNQTVASASEGGSEHSRYQSLHMTPEHSEPPFVQRHVETASTSELIRHDAVAEATVNLQNVAKGNFTGAGPVMASYYLERRSGTGDQHERMDVQGASFVIGRSADMVQWVDTATGVSRAHVELSRNKSGYVIKDLGSVNGTILQGNILAPYKEYPLADGDTFTLAESVYTYRSIG
ncbi:FHA domain-containing protein [Paenibacillus polymyxa]|uniref:DUF6382 domain-containing protein n=1 Tax=Paenibacillus polymyxa TaxID=1406 RepID=UPI001BE96C0A|nr:DUF6382 domain-containing protein [Paenibacillus polymyxa]MBT2284398.1 FHA domain-containing protein [Paenibacillus polymyxa]